MNFKITDKANISFSVMYVKLPAAYETIPPDPGTPPLEGGNLDMNGTDTSSENNWLEGSATTSTTSETPSSSVQSMAGDGPGSQDLDAVTLGDSSTGLTPSTTPPPRRKATRNNTLRHYTKRRKKKKGKLTKIKMKKTTVAS